jgi:hypothetical protein
MTADDSHAAGEELQFDRAVSNAPAAALSGAAQGTVMCRACSQPIDSNYYHLNGKVTCENCHSTIAAALASARQ